MNNKNNLSKGLALRVISWCVSLLVVASTSRKHSLPQKSITQTDEYNKCVCAQFLAAMMIHISCFLKKLLFRYTLLLPRLFLSSLMGDKVCICRTDWCHRSRLHTVSITPLTTNLRVKRLTRKAESKMTHMYPKKNYKQFQISPQNHSFQVSALWGPCEQIPGLKSYPQGAAITPRMGRLRPYSSQMRLWLRKELFFAIQPHWTGRPSFLSCGGGNLSLMNSLLHAPGEGGVFQFGHCEGDTFQKII